MSARNVLLALVGAAAPFLATVGWPASGREERRVVPAGGRPGLEAEGAHLCRGEREEARRAYEHARASYRQILSEARSD